MRTVPPAPTAKPEPTPSKPVGKVAGILDAYKAGGVEFDDVVARLAKFPWATQPEGTEGAVPHGDNERVWPAPDSIDEVFAAEMRGAITPDETERILAAVVGAAKPD
jgi:hypothetical protein